MSKCACCAKCGEPIQEPHNNNGLCNQCDPVLCYCGANLLHMTWGEYNYHVAGDRPCMPQPPATTKEKIWKNEKCPF